MRYLLVTFLLTFSFSLSAQQWQQMSDFPGGGRDDGSVFTVGSKVYCGLGMNPWFGCNGDFYVFDIDAESWSAGIPLPSGEERQYANGFAHNNIGFIFGGIDGSGNYKNDLWKFNPVSGIWTEKDTLPSAGRAGAVSFIIADTVYIIGGKTETEEALNEVWAYDLVNQSWSQKADLPFEIWRGVAFSWNGAGVVGSGKNNDGDLNETFYSYDPQMDEWQLIPGLTMEGTTYTAAAQIGKLAYLYGGMNTAGTYLNTFARIDLETFEVQALTDFPADARRGGMAFAGNDEFYLTTGVSSTGRLTETWKAGYVLGTNEIPESETTVKVFPNPSNGWLNVQSEEMIGRISISDLSGKNVFEMRPGGENIAFQAQLPAGIYLLEIESEQSKSKSRLLVRMD